MGASLGRAERCDTTRSIGLSSFFSCDDCDVIRSLTLSCDGGRNPDGSPIMGKFLLFEGSNNQVSSSDFYSSRCQVDEDSNILFCSISCDSREQLVIESFRPADNHFTIANTGDYPEGVNIQAHIVSSSLCHDNYGVRAFTTDFNEGTDCCRWEYYGS